MSLRGCLLLAMGALAWAQPERVLVVVNDQSAISKAIGKYYATRRAVPSKNVCHIWTAEGERIERDAYNSEVAGAVAGCLRKRHLTESVYYIVTTQGVPLLVDGAPRHGFDAEYAAVDSELALLYSDMKSKSLHALVGSLPNPFFEKRERAFSHPEFPIYLVTRLAAYDFETVKAIIDRSLRAENKGKFVFDARDDNDRMGDDWLRNAAIQIPKDRVILDETSKPVWGASDVIGYASWGSNDARHDRRFPGFHWLPGAIVTEYVSTDARTFQKPPNNWVSSRDWSTPSRWFANSPQSMTADYLLEGATGASGHVAEPYLHLNPRPDIIFPSYYSGRNLAESYYLGLPALSWQNVVIGDPLCTLGKPAR